MGLWGWSAAGVAYAIGWFPIAVVVGRCLRGMGDDYPVLPGQHQREAMGRVQVLGSQT